MRTDLRRWAVAAALCSGLAAGGSADADLPLTSNEARIIEGTLAGGARWRSEVPANWNGTLLLWSHGYSPRILPPDVAPGPIRDKLLARGYALLASDFGAAGWSIEQAVPSQRQAVIAFTEQIGKPSRTLAWGTSMGGLITTALAEQADPVIDAGLALCPSIGGSIGMMNMALDGAFAFQTLLAPQAGLELVRVTDDFANSARARAALDVAMQTAPGRARVALAGILAGLPGWTRPDHPQPHPDDLDGQVAEMAASFVMGVFLPRVDQERRAGGVFSWNDKVDYRRQLERSGRGAMVRALYQRAGLDIEADLDRLASAPRITADPKAVQYMMRHYTPTAKPRVPLISLQAVGDGLTSPSLQRFYVEQAPAALAQAIWLDAAGHCTFSDDQAMAALDRLAGRVVEGRWPDIPVQGAIQAAIAPMLRPCLQDGRCE
ncbi:MAG: alpha/beta hydrolase family protein [Niveispirillum sp.]|uniref:alpha/beta hydrolase family protein n=1 Tax=Niveispirillum sp. TaxID=1917217 RepID=UPI004034FC72